MQFFRYLDIKTLNNNLPINLLVNLTKLMNFYRFLKNYWYLIGKIYERCACSG